MGDSTPSFRPSFAARCSLCGRDASGEISTRLIYGAAAFTLRSIACQRHAKLVTELMLEVQTLLTCPDGEHVDDALLDEIGDGMRRLAARS